MSNWSPRAAHATEDYRNRVVELDTRIAELDAENERLRRRLAFEEGSSIKDAILEAEGGL